MQLQALEIVMKWNLMTKVSSCRPKEGVFNFHRHVFVEMDASFDGQIRAFDLCHDF